MRRAAYTSGDFDYNVRVAISSWETALELGTSWNDLDGEQQAALLEDWPLTNIIQQRLADYARKHELTEDQKTQFARLKDIVAKHSDTLRKIGYRVVSMEGSKGRAVA
ncbi:MAG: hypothetical protein EPO21_23360 [Chloroflexota bacterium]|nr:MAG: hypothetical protein EPO21_23360 [Chloroflexota bacterium]